MTNRKNLVRRFARHGADLSKRTSGTWSTFEDGTPAAWTIHWGGRVIPCHSLADAAAFLDRYEGKDR
jgi:hypothetical protein